MDPQEYDEIIRHLVRIAAHQDTINEDLRAMLSTHDERLKRQDAMNQRLTLAIERIDRTLAHVEITQARLETLLARMLRTDTNGQDA